VAVTDLIQEYPRFRALDRVSFGIQAGSVTALVGPNGAGKTTLMRCLAALDPPFAGRVHVAGLDAIERPRAVHRLTGFLQDFFGLYDSLTVAQGLWYAAAARGVAGADIDQRIRWAAEAVGLSDRLSQTAGTLSRGLRQRLAVAQTVVHRPRLVLLDEPASGLDPESRSDLAALIRNLRDAHGMTLIVSSHILAELEDYSTHVMILNHGRLVRHDPIADDTGNSHGWGSLDTQAEIEVALATPVPDLAARVRRLGLEPARVDTDGRAMAFASQVTPGTSAADLQAHAAILRTLVNDGLPVCRFAQQRRSLQDVYLDHVRRRPDGASGPITSAEVGR
jgi:ABC-2 type transport system ATP-binding protein